jgi:structural maintenance of chromosome 2
MIYSCVRINFGGFFRTFIDLIHCILFEMYIEEIVLEGFKSYATRTIIKGWDPSFNAITGLNGSGKSNILDAICFVLGIDNLRQIRATSLQDLVYKRGQAGITKATVSIVFNNQDLGCSPIGFQDCKQIIVSRQIVLGGKNTFKINGVTVPQNRVEMFFQSVQLNVNNPHFLIMQGRITKVLNMKPPELVAMLEETAGTRMYEERKEKAQHTLEKKEGKVHEIHNLIQDAVVPKMSKLKEERKAYLEYQVLAKNISDMEHSLILMDYQELKNKYSNYMNAWQALSTRLEQHSGQAQYLAQEVDAVAQQLVSLDEKEKQLDLNVSGSENTPQAQYKAISQQLTTFQTRQKLLATQKSQFLDQKKQIEAFLNEDSPIGSGVYGHGNEGSNEYDTTKKILDEKKEHLSQLEGLYNSLTTGISSKQGEQTGYSKLIQTESGNCAQLQTELETTLLSRQQMQAELDQLSKNRTLFETKAKNLEETLAAEELKFSRTRDVLNDMKMHASAELGQGKSVNEVLNSQFQVLKQHQQEYQTIQDSLDQVYSQISFAPFEYTRPRSDFNDSAVKGFIAELVSIPKQYQPWTEALEICAGGRLYSVVVENDQVAADLLNNGGLKKRVTIIPLNQIQPWVPPSDKLNKIKKDFSENAHLALSLVVFEQDLLPAMQFVFGSSILCSDSATAQSIAYDKTKNLHLRCITKEGDIYDPVGTMTGGSSSTKQSTSMALLLGLTKANEHKAQLKVCQGKIDTIQSKISALKAMQQRLSDQEQLVKRHEHEYNLCKSKMEADASFQSWGKMLSLAQELQALNKDKLPALKSKLEASQATLKKYQEEAQLAQSNPNRQAEQLSTQISQLKKECTKHSQRLQALLEAKMQFEAQKADLEEERKRRQADLDQLLKSFAEVQEEHDSCEQQITMLQAKHTILARQVEQEDTQRKALKTERIRLERSHKQAQEALSHHNASEKKISTEKERLERSKEESEKSIHQLLQKNPWIKNELSTPLTDSSGEPLSRDKILHQISKAKQSVREMNHSVNTDVMEMLDSLEKRESELKNHINMVQEDKEKIERTISKLNEHKREALSKTWVKVNQDFGEIFSLLLPGSFARFVPITDAADRDHSELGEEKLFAPISSPSNYNITGAEIQVRLGQVWKKSLTELSGGQRSLAALSFILALLQFKPAPMYILDEIDAALDLSHTQNIGKLLKHKFTSSQFIVVSLKDGLFNNANVLFRTRFIDGVSTIERITSTEEKNSTSQSTRTRKSVESNMGATRSSALVS